VLDRARQLLQERTGSSAAEGYQAGPERARVIAHAVYDAPAERRINYSGASASFDGYGQKIRTPDLVFSENCATCLDSRTR
jgi:hypothetical protein